MLRVNSPGEGIVALDIGTTLLVEDKLGRLDDGDGLRREAYAVSVLDIDCVVASLETDNVERALVERILDERALAVAAIDGVRNDTAMDIDIDGAIVVALTWTDVGELDLDIEPPYGSEIWIFSTETWHWFSSLTLTV